eukprot:7389938-Prymnesium_polylepis.1
MLCVRSGARVVLASRSGQVVRDGQGLDNQLSSIRSSATVLACDASEPADSLGALRMLAPQRLDGVLHAAGVLRDALLRNMRAEQVADVFASKAIAAPSLHALMMRLPALLVLFSSVTSALGNAGQTNYAAANGHMDALSQCRRAHAAASCSMQLPLVAGAGMGAATLMGSSPQESNGIALALDDYAAFVGSVLSSRRAGVASAVQMVWTNRALASIVSDASAPRWSELPLDRVAPAAAQVEIMESVDSSATGDDVQPDSPLLRMSIEDRRSHIADLIDRTIVDLGRAAGMSAD